MQHRVRCHRDAPQTKGLIRDFKIEAAKCQLVRGLDVIETTVEILRERPDALLCSNPCCYFCTHARKKTECHPRSVV